jgi:diguanylate cyclase (GGDEF)-like protein
MVGTIFFLLSQKNSVEEEQYKFYTNNLHTNVYNLIRMKKANTTSLTLIMANDRRIINAIKSKNFSSLHETLTSINKFIKKSSHYKNLWFQVIDKNGISIYRSWSKKSGDSLMKARLDVARMIKSKHKEIKTVISTGKFDMTFKTLVPIYDNNNEFIGIISVLSHFNSIAKNLYNRGIESAVVVDKKYTPQLTNAFTKKFIGGYYIANLTLDKKIESIIQKYGIEDILNVKRYRFFDEYLVSRFDIKDINGNPMAYYITFTNLNFMSNISKVNSIFSNTLVLFSILLIIMIINILSLLYFIKEHLTFINHTKELLEEEIDIKTHQIRESLIKDKLTGAYKKTKLEDDLKQKKHHALILLNIDNFSYINSSFGFNVGDKILSLVVKRLKSFTDSNIYRINADEFAIIKENYKDIINTIKNNFLNDPIRIDDIVFRIRFSFGISLEKDGSLRKASVALKEAKKEGKNRYIVFKEEGSIQKRKDFIEWNEKLYNALKNDELVPFFQGIRDNKTQKIIKYEALARIIHKDEIYSPYLFLEVAKIGGFITDITKTMIQKSFEIMQNKDCEISINVSEDDFDEHYLIEYLISMSQKYNISPNRVTLEILEGISNDGTKNSIAQLKALRELGFKISIDDFGTEYSNFERLSEIEVDYIKIDGKYIKDIETNEKSQKIVKVIVDMAHMLNAKVIAEFVHNEGVQKKVEELGIEFSQGYFFSTPKKYI